MGSWVGRCAARTHLSELLGALGALLEASGENQTGGNTITTLKENLCSLKGQQCIKVPKATQRHLSLINTLLMHSSALKLHLSLG